MFRPIILSYIFEIFLWIKFVFKIAFPIHPLIKMLAPNTVALTLVLSASKFLIRALKWWTNKPNEYLAKYVSILKAVEIAHCSVADENGPEVCTCGSGEQFPSWLELDGGGPDSLTNVLLGCHFIIGIS